MKNHGPQVISLKKNGCLYIDTILHEFIHALGFHHEQNRPDRDKWVKINFHEIERNMWHNFKKYNSYPKMYTPYDFKSIMYQFFF